MSALTETTTATIEATARVIQDLTAAPIDMRTKLERIAYAAAVLRRQAEAGLEQFDEITEVSHG